MSIMSYSGGTVLAMAGEECICIATDLRLGEQRLTVAANVEKIHKLGDRLYVGFGGFHSDAKTLFDKIVFRKKLYELREMRKMKPKVAATMISNMLYHHRFGSYFVNPLVAGLDPLTNKAYICSMDSIGCLDEAKDFVAVGTGSEYLLAMCEGFWQPNLSPSELCEVTSQAMLSAMERDAASGWGVVVYLITPDEISVKTLKGRMD